LVTHLFFFLSIPMAMPVERFSSVTSRFLIGRPSRSGCRGSCLPIYFSSLRVTLRASAWGFPVGLPISSCITRFFRCAFFFLLVDCNIPPQLLRILSRRSPHSQLFLSPLGYFPRVFFLRSELFHSLCRGTIVSREIVAPPIFYSSFVFWVSLPIFTPFHSRPSHSASFFAL